MVDKYVQKCVRNTMVNQIYFIKKNLDITGTINMIKSKMKKKNFKIHKIELR